MVELPPELQNLVVLGVQILVTFLLTEAAKFLPFDISGYKAQITAAIFGAVMVIINGFLSQIPLESETIAIAVLNLAVVVLGSFGVYKLYKGRIKG